MDVNRAGWPYALHPMLAALSHAHFVALDLELSGISLKSTGVVEDGSSRMQTLQQRYEDMKEAAEKYQILQVGLTLVREDVDDRAGYIAQPYNMYLSPIIQEHLGIDRDFAFCSASASFLIDHGFNIEGPFNNGLLYLSREEETSAVTAETARLDRKAIPDVHLRDDEKEHLELVHNVRKKIRRWLRSKDRSEFLSVTPDNYQIGGEMPRGFSKFQQRLIHQLVRAEFPSLISINQPGFMQIKNFNAMHEETLTKVRLKTFSEKISRQTGLRWFVEAMVGGSLETLDPTTLIRPIDGRPPWFNRKNVEADFGVLRRRLQNHRTVLVGHNIFVDLIYFYRCFIGPLPSSVQEFKSEIHKLFPMIIDTKYLATHLNNSNDVRSGLVELDMDLSSMKIPAIDCHPTHKRYEKDRPSHEAGFDSFMTARVAIRLAAKLEALGSDVDMENGMEKETEKEPDADSYEMEDIEEQYTLKRKISDTYRDVSNPRPLQSIRNSDIGQDDLRVPRSENPRTRTTAMNSGNAYHNESAEPSVVSNLQPAVDDLSQSPSDVSREHSDSLCELMEDGIDPFQSLTIIKQQRTDCGSESSASIIAPQKLGKSKDTRQRFVYPKPGANVSSAAVPTPNRMPRFNSDFWRIYGNKLRINGTAEEVLDLSPETAAQKQSKQGRR